MAGNSKLSFCRLTYDIPNHGQGAGDWQDIEKESLVQAWVKDCNERYGAGTHKIEYGDGNKSYDIAQKAIEKGMNPNGAVS